MGYVVDRRDRHRAMGSRGREQRLQHPDHGVPVGQPDRQFTFQIGAGFATYGVGKAFGNQKAADVGRDIVRAQVLSQVLVQAVKYTVRRERPDGSNNKSFPSGHSASAFATATVLQRHYGWKVGVPAYALGSYVALARMAWNRHHATDVVMGAGFGIASARTVTMSMAKSKFSVGVQPQVGGASVNFTKIVQVCLPASSGWRRSP